MTWKMGLVLGAAALVACGESNRHDMGSGPGAGAMTGGSTATGGGSGQGGQATITPPLCPEEKPAAGSVCDTTAINCSYDVCGDDTVEMFSCRAGQWRLARACGPLECPAERPSFLSDCAPLEGLECRYVEDCCGAEPATQSVVARCEFGEWTLLGPPRAEACSFCQVSHQHGTACDLPPECINTGCYAISCYAQPLVEECVDGLWRVETRCTK